MADATGSTGFGFESTAEEVTEGVSLAGKTMLVTGANSGIGKETVRVLALRGAHVICAARTVAKAEAAIADLGIADQATPLACELSDLDSVRAAATAVGELGRTVDAIVANAGIMALQEPEQVHGIERQLFTNHIGHFTLITGILDLEPDVLADDARIVIVSSGAHRMHPEPGIDFDNLSFERDYQPWTAYGQSKLANILFARSLADRFEGTARTANALHPGVIETNLGRHLPDYEGTLSNMTLKSIPQGAATQAYLAAHPDGNATSGEYWSDCNVAKAKSKAYDDALAGKLWAWSESVVAAV